MTYRGKVKNGVVVVSGAGVALPEGADVRVEVLEKPKKRRPQRKIMRHAGVAKGLPPDASTNLEHYLYGHPKR